jgi:hypothetical protein
MNATGIGMGMPGECQTVKVTGVINVSGSFIVNADGSFKDQTTTTGEESLILADECLNVSGTRTTCDLTTAGLQNFGYSEKPTCTALPAGGCSCKAKISQKGGIGYKSNDPLAMGDLAKADSNVVLGQNSLNGDDLQFGFCVSGTKMTWTPNPKGPEYKGAIVFQKSGGGGTGGSTGGSTGGTSGKGGATGGTTSKGGSSSVSSGGTTTGGSSSSGGTTSTGGGGGGTPSGNGPCDILDTAKTPCVGAYSMVRSLYKAYSGALYQLRNGSNTKDVPVLAAGGFADVKVHEDFCGTASSSACTIAKLYDQSPNKNDMPITEPVFWIKAGEMKESKANLSKHTVGGHTVYGLRFTGGQKNSYRCMKNCKGVAVGDEPEFMYMVVDATVFSTGCCNDFGNAETTGTPDGAATMETIYYGKETMFGHGSGSGPWLLADLEAGTYPSDKGVDNNISSLTIPKYATLMLKGFSGNRYALKYGDAQQGALTTQWDGKRPSGYSPMKKQGSIVLGTGGDGSFYSNGVFLEGAITQGCADDKAVDEAIQSNVTSAGYGK